MFDPMVPLVFDAASIDLVLVSNASGTLGLAELQRMPGFRAPVICSEATAVLCRLEGVQRVSMGQRVTVAKDVIVEGLSSGYSLGSLNWKLNLFGRVVSVLCESSVWPNRHPLPFDLELLEECDLLVTAIARAALGEGNVSKVASELRSLLSASPVVVPLASLTGPVMLDVLDMMREQQPAPTTVLVARDAPVIMASLAVLAEYFDSSRLSRVHNGDAPVALTPQVISNLSLPIQARAQTLFLTDNLPGLLSAAGSSCVVVGCDPCIAASSVPSGTRMWPVDSGLNAGQLRALCDRIPTVTVQHLGSSCPFPVHLRLPVSASQRCFLVSQHPNPVDAKSRVRVVVDGLRDEVVVSPAGPSAPTSEQLARALRRAGISLVQLKRKNNGEFAMVLPTLNHASIEVDAMQTRLVAGSAEVFELLSAVLRNVS